LRKAVVCAVVLACVLGFEAAAHDARPVFVQIEERGEGGLDVQWRVPNALPASAMPEPVLPDGVEPVGERIVVQQPDGWLNRQHFRYEGTVAGKDIGIRYPHHNPSLSTLYRVELGSGVVHSRLLSPGESSWRVPEQPDRLGVARDYTALGIRHILEGIDHLLFVFCLLIIAGPGRKLIRTITGFTLAHSLTLALSALDIVRVPVPPVEAAIALSIVFLASEIAAGRKGSLTYRYPGLVAITFGLLHGFGFAAVLRETGLPQMEIPTALLFFNVGVEIGQLMFVGALLMGFLALRWGMRHVPVISDNLVRAGRGGELLAAYVAGSIAALWMIQRVTGFWT
jgi:hydrogenase/urease accessory protein HupE